MPHSALVAINLDIRSLYLLWNDGNVDEIVPSLYAGRSGRRG